MGNYSRVEGLATGRGHGPEVLLNAILQGSVSKGTANKPPLVFVDYTGIEDFSPQDKLGKASGEASIPDASETAPSPPAQL